MENEPFRQRLQAELLRRIEKNPRYSLRAFSSLLETDSSTLSQILRGKRTCSVKLQKDYCDKLAWNFDQTNKSEFERLAALDPQDRSYRNLTMDAFSVIADWYHFAITQLMQTKGFKQDSEWIAKRLGISKNEANVAIERLIALDIIEVGPKGKWICHEAHISTLSTPHSAVAYRKMQKQLLEKALVALEEISLEERDQSSMSFRMNPQQIPKVKELNRDYRRKLCALMEADPQCSEVYQLTISFFPLSQGIDRKSAKKRTKDL